LRLRQFFSKTIKEILILLIILIIVIIVMIITIIIIDYAKQTIYNFSHHLMTDLQSVPEQ